MVASFCDGIWDGDYEMVFMDGGYEMVSGVVALTSLT
jgi:hypothetical protein